MALNKTAYSKRVEQLKRYEDSETNRESVSPKIANARKVRFSAGCIFLAACASGDKDEVLNMLNSVGADIDTANVDGLTALHQVNICRRCTTRPGGRARGNFRLGEIFHFGGKIKLLLRISTTAKRGRRRGEKKS